MKFQCWMLAMSLNKKYPIRVMRPCSDVDDEFCVLNVTRNIYNTCYNSSVNPIKGFYYKVQIPLGFIKNKPYLWSVRYVRKDLIYSLL